MLRFLAVASLVLATTPARAAVEPGDMPGSTTWYLHADLEGMRASGSGSKLYGWLDGEVFVEINDEIGIDINKEIERVTAYSDPAAGIVIIVDGPLSQETRDKLLAIVAVKSGYDLRSHDGRDYYYSGDLSGEGRKGHPLDDLDESAFFSFAVPERLILTSREEEMQKLLERRGRILGGGNHNGALLVLTADSSFVQAGLRTGEMAAREGSDWDSNILRNTEQAALLIADRDGLLALQVQLQSRDPKMAQSLHSVINGLISLQAFNADIDPEIRTLINNTRVELEDAVLSVSTVFDPDRLLQIID